MEFVEVPYIDQSEVDTLDTTSFGATVTVRILLIIHFLMRNYGKRGGGAADHGDWQPQVMSPSERMALRRARIRAAFFFFFF